MIDDRILKSLISTFDDPSFSVLINNFSQNNECNKDEIIISLEQVTPNLYKLLQTKEYIIDELINLLQENNITIPNSIKNRNKEHINTIVEKKIILNSGINVNENKDIKSEINGYVDILSYGNIMSQEVIGTINSRVVRVTSRGYPVYIPIDRIKVRTNTLLITVPSNLKNFIIKIDDQVKQYTQENNIITVNHRNIHTGNHTFNIKYLTNEDITNQNVEVVVTPIAKTIDIEFNEPHDNIPSVILTVDKKDTNLYSTYTTDFVIDEETHKYTGVTLTFKNLRRKASYPNINICVLGE